MAAEVADEPKAQHGDHDTASPAKGNSRKKLLIGAIVLVVVAVQAIVTWLLLPTSSSDGGHVKADTKEHASAASHEPEDDAPEGDVSEVALGDFSFSNTTAMAGAILHVDFKLAALTSSKQASSLEGSVKKNTARVPPPPHQNVPPPHLPLVNPPPPPPATSPHSPM